MSRSIYWTPKSSCMLNTYSEGASSVIKQIEKVFGGLPLSLGRNDIDELNVMSDMLGYTPNPYNDLVDSILSHGTILIEVEF